MCILNTYIYVCSILTKHGSLSWNGEWTELKQAMQLRWDTLHFLLQNATVSASLSCSLVTGLKWESIYLLQISSSASPQLQQGSQKEISTKTQLLRILLISWEKYLNPPNFTHLTVTKYSGKSKITIKKTVFYLEGVKISKRTWVDESICFVYLVSADEIKWFDLAALEHELELGFEEKLKEKKMWNYCFTRCKKEKCQSKGRVNLVLKDQTEWNSTNRRDFSLSSWHDLSNRERGRESQFSV
jgi:hypothetical protein